MPSGLRPSTLPLHCGGYVVVTLLREFIGFYNADYPALLARLDKGIEERNTKDAKTATHKLHGLAASFDGQIAVVLAMKVETLVDNQEFAEAARTLPALKRSLNDDPTRESCVASCRD